MVNPEYASESNPTRSVPSAKSVIVSASLVLDPPSPERVIKVSIPLPPVRVSAPVPPSNLSSPSFPTSVSFPEPPYKRSLP